MSRKATLEGYCNHFAIKVKKGQSNASLFEDIVILNSKTLWDNEEKFFLYRIKGLIQKIEAVKQKNVDVDKLEELASGCFLLEGLEFEDFKIELIKLILSNVIRKHRVAGYYINGISYIKNVLICLGIDIY